MATRRKKTTKKASGSTPKWTAARMAKAREAYDMGASATDVAKTLKIPAKMVQDYFAKLDEEPPSETDAEPEAEEEETPEEGEPEPEPEKAPPKKAAAKKKAAKKKTSKKKSKKAPEKPKSKGQLIDDLIASVNSHMKRNVITRASRTNTSYLLRRPTGLLSLDIALAGGWPAGSFCQIAGPDGAGKDYLLGRSIAQLQRAYGEDTAVAIWNNEFKLDKMFFREKCGVMVALTGEEIDELREVRERMGYSAMSAQEEEALTEQIGHVALIEETLADHALDAILDMLHSNLFQILCINSLGNLQTLAKDSTDSLGDFAQQSNEAILISKFFPKFFSFLNADGEDGRKNETTVLATNQVRGKRDVRRMPGRTLTDAQKTQSALQAHALKHGKAIDVMLSKGPPFLDKDVKPPEMLGREVKWVLEKGKLGTHDGIKGSYNFYYEYGADEVEDIFSTAVTMGVLEQSGAWYEFDPDDMDLGFRAQGKAGAKRALMGNPEAIAAIRRACLHEAGIYARFT